ncbi:MAG: glycosyltransferase [Microbacteriaceae bacterium]
MSLTGRLLFGAQRTLVVLSHRWHRRRPPARQVSWVVGTVEVAAMVTNFARAVPGSYSVVTVRNRYYDVAYDREIPDGRGAWVTAAWEFGRLVAHARGFIYLGTEGFLRTDVDDRDWEFGFVKRHGRGLVCVFAGTDIRSPVLMRQFEKETGLETIVTYLDQLSPALASPAYDDLRKRVAAVADRHADAVFTATVDQLGYLQRPTEAFPYFFPDADILSDDTKHHAPGPRIVVHAPSAPIIKGTQVVRAAVQRLRSEGYDFDYRELIGVPNSEVLATLREAHVVLNEFYAFVPGVFGVEAMASGCALLTRADEHIETDLPAGSNDAWMVTTAADIATNLRLLLDEPERIGSLAAAGRRWVLEHATISASGARIAAVLSRIAPDGT